MTSSYNHKNNNGEEPKGAPRRYCFSLNDY